jgi:glycosyltransferase involved in cell wall biosynthesis
VSKILIIYDYFLPAWKAGGPIRSLVQLINNLNDRFDFSFVCSAYESDERERLIGIKTDQWTAWNNSTKIFYKSERSSTKKYFLEKYLEISPDIIYINGLFSYNYNIVPLLAAKFYVKRNTNVKIILSPRGMLHQGALSQKRFKKKLFILVSSMLGLYNKVEWHATDEKEVHFIRCKFKHAKIHIAGNFPKISDPLSSPIKSKGELIIGTLALISPMKNHLEILKALKSITLKVIWHIYGPVKDVAYWDLCKEMITQLPKNIQVHYHGAIPPDQIKTSLERIQLFVLPSKSENFGHAIFEALSAGKPVITTNTTPFTDLNPNKAGYTLSINNLQHQLIQAIHDFAQMDQETFSQYQKNAMQYANRFINVEKLKSQYRTMFSTA